MYLETFQLRQMPRSMAGSYILFVQKRRQRGHNYLASNLLTQLWQYKMQAILKDIVGQGQTAPINCRTIIENKDVRSLPIFNTLEI